jgi:type IV secretion system protein VirB5
LALSAVLLTSQPARAALPVIDLTAITHLVTQIRTMEQQLLTARDQLTNAQSTLTAMTGHRGMENLLAGTIRNYLPEDAEQLLQVMQGASAAYAALSQNVQTLLHTNAILANADLAQLTPLQRGFIEDARREAATLDALTRGALTNTSGRFEAIQQLIAAIATAPDQKAILDLQARIAAEQGMLQNEATKLEVLYRASEAQRLERAQRVREEAIAEVGSLRLLPALNLPVPAI